MKTNTQKLETDFILNSNRDSRVLDQYDLTTEFIETPQGIGKFYAHDPNTGKTTVEFDYECLVEFDDKDCYVVKEETK